MLALSMSKSRKPSRTKDHDCPMSNVVNMKERELRLTSRWPDSIRKRELHVELFVGRILYVVNLSSKSALALNMLIVLVKGRMQGASVTVLPMNVCTYPKPTGQLLEQTHQRASGPPGHEFQKNVDALLHP